MNKKPATKPPADLNQLATSTVSDAKSVKPAEASPPENAEKNAHAVAPGRPGSLKGGRMRASKRKPEKRKEIAEKAAKARWEKRL